MLGFLSAIGGIILLQIIAIIAIRAHWTRWRARLAQWADDGFPEHPEFP